MYLCNSNLCSVEPVLWEWENAKFAKITSSNLFLLHQFTATSQYVSDQTYFLLPSAICGKIRGKKQRTNYIWNTDPSNLALSKTQIFNHVGSVHFHKETIRKSVILFVSLFYTLSSTLSSFAPFCVWSGEYELPDSILKHCTEPPISIKFKTQ